MSRKKRRVNETEPADPNVTREGFRVEVLGVDEETGKRMSITTPTEKVVSNLALLRRRAMRKAQGAPEREWPTRKHIETAARLAAKRQRTSKRKAT